MVEAIKVINRLIVIKLSGKNIDDVACLEDVSRQSVVLQKLGAQVILVHGGGQRINLALKDAGIIPKFHDGQRITDDATMEIVAKVLGEEVNHQLAESIRQKGGEVICGKQTQVLRSAPLSNNSDDVSLGRVGKVVEVKPLLNQFRDQGGGQDGVLDGKIAVIAPTARDITDNSEYNINADWAATAIAAAYQADYLFYMTDQEGILGSEHKAIERIDQEQISQLIEQGIVTDGMIPKILSMREALQQGVKQIAVVNGFTRNIICDFLDGKSAGTTIY
ncbi:MAG: acetylglutamate kinase [Gammaproteobacteria bacterium]|nr:acetylglutamate kinase [Gammaproteobacteria bacterium]